MQIRTQIFIFCLLCLISCSEPARIAQPTEPIIFVIPNLEHPLRVKKSEKIFQETLSNSKQLTSTKILSDSLKPPFSIVFPILAPEVSSNFGMRFHPIKKFTRQHSGIDLAAPESSHVRAVADGKIVFAGNYQGYGKLVTIEHTEHYLSLYAHLSEINVYTGQKVGSGTLIGRVGSTGHSTGPHLHFEWRVDSIPVDPIKVFPLLAADAKG